MSVDVSTKDGFIEALRLLDANNACEACGQANWYVYDKAYHREAELVVHRSVGQDEGKPNMHYPVLMKVCSNCGNTRLHNKPVLKQSLKKLENSKSGNSDSE